VEPMMIQPGKRPGGKQHIDDDAIGHRLLGWHVADVSKGSRTSLLARAPA
jgi:hypothetical protein